MYVLLPSVKVCLLEAYTFGDPNVSSESRRGIVSPWKRWLFSREKRREFAVSQAPRISSGDSFPSYHVKEDRFQIYKSELLIVR